MADSEEVIILEVIQFLAGFVGMNISEKPQNY